MVSAADEMDSDPEVTSSRLRGWFFDITKNFPSINGVQAEDNLPDDETSATDYSIGREFIYACFAWSKQSVALETVVQLAAKHQVGLFNVSSGAQQVWIPKDGKLVLQYQSRSLMNKIRGLFLPS